VQKQLVIGDESRPKKFRSRNPKEAFLERLNYIEKEWMDNHNRRVELVNHEIQGFEDLFKSNKEDIEEEQGVWTIVGLTNIISRIQKLLEKTNNKLRIITANPEVIIDKLPTPKKSVTVEIKSDTEDDLYNSLSDKFFKVDQVGGATVIIFDDFVGILTQIREIVESSIIEFY
jgi:sugar-specific transcriptional regulator TrmB